MPDSVIFKDGAGRWLQANDFGLRLFELTDVAYQGRTGAELAGLRPQYAAAFAECARTDERAWEAGVATSSEETVPQPEGAALTFEVIKVPLFHHDGRRKGLVVIGRDITERKRAREELERERAYLSSAVETLPLPLAFLSETGEVTQANAAAHAFFGELPPERWEECRWLSPDTRAPLAPEDLPLAAALRGEAASSRECLLVIPEGREVPVLQLAAPIIVGGTIVAAVLVLQDITALKEADQAKNQFLGILSYELLTPLSDIVGWIQAAHETPELIPQALQIIEHNARLQQRVLTDLLDLSRIIHGKLYLDRRSVDLWDMVEQELAEFEPGARERRRTVLLEPPEEDLPVSADTARVRQVIAALLANALRNTEPGDAITISGVREGEVALVTIRDSGRSIPPEARASVFKPFAQVQAGEPGRGLTMALVKGIVEQHGGEITLDDIAHDEGSSFTISLPLE
jgi:PAS domain S-box-containing protein